MEYRFLGNSGLKVSALSFGSWVTFGNQMDVDASMACMKAAWEGGCNFFDNAEVYAGGVAEELMGEALRQFGWGRSEYVVSTKIFWGGEGVNQRGLSRKHIFEGCDAALKRLGLEYVDLVFCHRPDPETPMEETVRAMSDLVSSGRAFYWGTSEWSAVEILDAWHIAKRERLVAPTMEQPEYNMFHRDRVEVEYAPLYERFGLGTTIWSPLSSGLLTGKYDDGIPEDSRANVEGYEWLRKRFESDAASLRIAKVRALKEIADDLGCSRANLALAWCLKNPRVSTVITGASRVSQVESNFLALEVLEKLDDSVMERIEEILDNTPKPAASFR